MQEFTAVAQARPQGGIAIRVPFDPAAAWGERWIESAKRPDTRAKRIGEMVDTLTAGKRER